MSDVEKKTRLPTEALRWSCDEVCFPFETTKEVEAIEHVVAQASAREALEFGILTRARGQNVYVRGARGTGRRTMVRRLLSDLRHEVADDVTLYDHCYVHNFHRPDRPRLLRLQPGQGRELRRRMREFARFVKEDLVKLLDTEPLLAERRAIEMRMKEGIRQLTEPLEQELEEQGLRLVQMEGPVPRSLILPVVDGEPVPPPVLEQAIKKGEAPADALERYKELAPKFQHRVEDVGAKVMQIQHEGMEAIRKQIQATARDLLSENLARIRADYRTDAVAKFLDECTEDVIEERLNPAGPLPDPAERYGVNVVNEAPLDFEPPIVEEATPSLTNLLGTVELGWTKDGPAPPDYNGVRSGALLRADGGFLVLDIYDLLSEPGSWRALMRILRSGLLEIVPPEMAWFRSGGLVNPEPIPVEVRVILIGDPNTYYMLDRADPDFGELFKVLADFDHEIPRDEDGVRNYSEVIAHIVRSERLVTFHRSAVRTLAEHGARIVARRDKLTARFGRLGDLAREASFLAKREGADLVVEQHVREAVRRTKQRANLPSRKFQELIGNGVIRIETSGEVVGQVNGLAVMSSGPVTYGFPARITATIGVGQAGLIDIESSAQLSGAIHTKGFHILNGLLRHLLRAEHPLAFSASLAFEQSYGGIDGDSASGAETCCLLSALTGVPLRQSLAMTGAIDQHGHIQAIGGVNEKIEGFFDTCSVAGITGDQGVIIPSSNAGDLMLRPDVVEACDQGRFHIYAVETIHQALELFTGMPAGELSADGEGEYPAGTLLQLAVERADQFWRRATRPSRARKSSDAEDDTTEGAEADDAIAAAESGEDAIPTEES